MQPGSRCAVGRRTRRKVSTLKIISFRAKSEQAEEPPTLDIAWAGAAGDRAAIRRPRVISCVMMR